MKEMQHGNSQNSTASAGHGGGGKVVATTLNAPFGKKPTANASKLAGTYKP